MAQRRLKQTGLKQTGLKQTRLLLLPLVVRYRLTPWWVRVLVIWAASRVITTSLLVGFANQQAPNPWTGAHPDYLSFASLWDGNWYHIVAVVGYPSTLPLTVDGHVGENAWAFMPGYPAVVRLLMELTGLPWGPLAVFAAFAFSLAGALMFYKLVRLVLPADSTLFSVVLLCVAPLSPIMQVAYAESMHAFLLTVALYFLLRRRYLLLFPIVAVMSLTRPSGLAFALALALHVGYRWFVRRRDPFPIRARVAAVAAAVFSGVMGIAWPLIAWLVTGSPTAYTDTELVWRAPYLGYRALVPFTPWIQGANFWMPFPLGIIVLAAVLIGFAAFLFTPQVRRLGADLRFWVGSYCLYLLAVFFPQSSTFRLLIPLFPLLGAVAQPRSRLYRAALVVLFIAGQWGWIYICWWFNGYDWTPP